MAVVYIKEQGACIKKHRNRLIIEKDGELLAELRLIRVTGISVIGNVQITTQALHTILQAGVDVSFFSGSGRYLSHMAPEHSKNIFLRLSQYHCYESLPERLTFARAIVANKIENQMEMIRKYRWNDTDYDYKNDLNCMLSYQKTLERKETVNGLMGVEGICSAIYFRSYAKMFKSSISFQERNRREKVRSNNPSAGTDQISCAQFDANSQIELKQLNLELYNHEYRVRQVRLVSLEKEEKVREISLYTMRDKVV